MSLTRSQHERTAAVFLKLSVLPTLEFFLRYHQEIAAEGSCRRSCCRRQSIELVVPEHAQIWQKKERKREAAKWSVRKWNPFLLMCAYKRPGLRRKQDLLPLLLFSPEFRKKRKDILSFPKKRNFMPLYMYAAAASHIFPHPFTEKKRGREEGGNSPIFPPPFFSPLRKSDAMSTPRTI